MRRPRRRFRKSGTRSSSRKWCIRSSRPPGPSYLTSTKATAYEGKREIAKALVGQAPRTFEATFYNQAGHSTSQSFTIMLKCPTATDAICGGTKDRPI